MTITIKSFRYVPLLYEFEARDSIKRHYALIRAYNIDYSSVLESCMVDEPLTVTPVQFLPCKFNCCFPVEVVCLYSLIPDISYAARSPSPVAINKPELTRLPWTLPDLDWHAAGVSFCRLSAM